MRWICYDIKECISTGGWFNINMSSSQYRKSHCRDKTILRPSYLHNGISYTGKLASLCWIRSLIVVFVSFAGKRVEWNVKGLHTPGIIIDATERPLCAASLTASWKIMKQRHWLLHKHCNYIPRLIQHHLQILLVTTGHTLMRRIIQQC